MNARQRTPEGDASSTGAGSSGKSREAKTRFTFAVCVSRVGMGVSVSTSTDESCPPVWSYPERCIGTSSASPMRTPAAATEKAS
jgi:hypothetical protein